MEKVAKELCLFFGLAHDLRNSRQSSLRPALGGGIY
jgi:hypothetical protein